MTELRVKTPEGVLFSFSLASPILRFLAWTVDALVVGVLTGLISTVLTILQVISVDLAKAMGILSYFAISIGYGIVTEWYWRGQTLGKRMVHLRVMDEQGLRLRFDQIVIRNLLRAVDALPLFYVPGGLCCLFSTRAQRLGDFAANTVVVRNPRITVPDVDQLTQGKFNSLRQYPHLEARLRQRVSPQVAGVLLQALLRRDGFDAAARVSLFAELANYCRGLVHFPAEVTEAIPDEQYVRNVVEVIFRKASRN